MPFISKSSAAIALVWCLVAFPETQTSQTYRSGKVAKEQTSFSTDTEIERPVALPIEVLESLLADEEIVSRPQFENADPVTASWFTASEIDLNGDAQRDLVVQGTDVRIMGAHTCLFWVFRKTPSRYEKVFAVSADGITIGKKKTKGHRDIYVAYLRADELTAVTYRFDGKRYKYFRAEVESLR